MDLNPVTASAATPDQPTPPYARWRINDRPAHPDDRPFGAESESLIAPLVTLPVPDFPVALPLYRADEAREDDSALDAMGNEPEWMTEFNPWIGEAIREYRNVHESSGLCGDLPYIGGVL
jgi:hypothetical protein